jgi:hypothetical protein
MPEVGGAKELGLIMRFSASLEKPGLKPIPENYLFSAGLKSSSPC